MPYYLKSSRNFKDQQRILSIYRKLPLNYVTRKLINRRQEKKYSTKKFEYKRLSSKLRRQNFARLRPSSGASKTTKEKFPVDHKAPLRVSIDDGTFFPDPIRPPLDAINQSGVELRGEIADPFSEYYRTNKMDHHVWTDHVVINRGTDVTRKSSTDGDFHNFVKIEKLLAGSFMVEFRSPEKFFYLKKTPIMGLGLFAKDKIRRGTLIGEYTGEMITQSEADKREELYDELGLVSYTFEVGWMVIDAGPMGNHCRFINHSCNPNCQVQSTLINGLPRLFVKTIKTIEKDEEVYINYGKRYFKGSGIKCKCGQPSCFETK